MFETIQIAICTYINYPLVPLASLAALETIAVFSRATGLSMIFPGASASEFFLSIKTFQKQFVALKRNNNDIISTNKNKNDSTSSTVPVTKKIPQLKLVLINFFALFIFVLILILPTNILINSFKESLFTSDITKSGNLIDLEGRDYRTVGFSLEHYHESVSGPNLNINFPQYSRSVGILMDEDTLSVLADSRYGTPTGGTADTMWLYDMSNYNPHFYKYLTAGECLPSKLPLNPSQRSWSRSNCVATPEVRTSLDCQGSYIKMTPRKSSLIDCSKSGYGGLWNITKSGTKFNRMDGSITALSDFEPFETLNPQMETSSTTYLKFSNDQIRQLQSYFFLKGLARVYVTIYVSLHDPEQRTFTNANQLSGFLSNRLYGMATQSLVISTYAPGKTDNTIVGRSVLIISPTSGYSSPNDIKAYFKEHVYDITIETTSKKLGKRYMSDENSEENDDTLLGEENENYYTNTRKLNILFIGIMFYYVVIVSLACYLGRNTLVDLIYAYFTTDFKSVVHLAFGSRPKQSHHQYEVVHPTDEKFLKSNNNIQSV